MTTNLEVGDYLLQSKLGEGAMGETWLASHRWMKRLYVLKLLPEELSRDVEFISRLEREVERLSLVQHPHLLKMHNVLHMEGHFALVYPYLEGACDLNAYLRQNDGKLPEEQILRIARQLASCLDYVHQQALGEDFLVHLGIKPSQILVQTTEEGPVVYLCDLGLAQIVGPERIVSRTYRVLCDQLPFGVGFSWDQKKYLPGPTQLEQMECAHESFLQGFFCLAPEQRRAELLFSNLIKVDTYAFGAIIYYLLRGEFADFPQPFSLEHLRWNWELLLTRCLHSESVERPELLSPTIEELLPSAQQQISRLKEALRPILKPQELVKPSFDPDPAAIFQTELSVGRYHPAVEENKQIEPLMSEMVVIPKGAYFRGCNTGSRDEMPRHIVQLDGYAIDIHPVTNEQFVRFLEAMGGEKEGNNNDILRLKESRIKRASGKLHIESGYAQHPVVGVTWYGAVAYAKWVGKRLPTEAEWEVAAYGAKEDFPYPSGHQIEKTQANFFSSDTTPVMSFPPNLLGLFDMAGNVYEWCSDWYDYHYYDISAQEPNDPQGPAQGVYRTLRGGCWKSLKQDLRCSHRHRNNPGTVNTTYGFRCAAAIC